MRINPELYIQKIYLWIESEKSGMSDLEIESINIAKEKLDSAMLVIRGAIVRSQLNKNSKRIY